MNIQHADCCAEAGVEDVAKMAADLSHVESSGFASGVNSWQNPRSHQLIVTCGLVSESVQASGIWLSQEIPAGTGILNTRQQQLQGMVEL